jgi:predicted nucleic acid-binding protein
LTIFCLDTSVWIKYLCPDEQSEAATKVVTQALTERLISPSFAWAEIASVLRKKVRSSLLTADEAQQLYTAFCSFPIEYVDTQNIRLRAWEIAEQYQLLTLYDSVFLAVAEIESAQFWTADQALLRKLIPLPLYIHALN